MVVMEMNNNERINTINQLLDHFGGCEGSSDAFPDN